jgi:uncharacterized protein (TIGR03118 family)
MNSFKRLVFPVAVVAAAIALIAAARAADPKNAYAFKVLVSDKPGAPVPDKNLKNAWGVAFSPAGSPFWIADNNAGVSTLYEGDGTIVPLVVTIPCPPKAGEGSGCPASAAPTGMIWNPTNDPSSAFLVRGTKFPAAFIWATEDGTLAAWSGKLANINKAVLSVDNAVKPSKTLGAVYKGLAFGVNIKQGPLLFAANFRGGKIDVFAPRQNSSGVGLSYKAATTTGGFKDPLKGILAIPANYAPFGIQNLDGNLIVTYGQQNTDKHDDVEGAGHGFVDAFDTDGNFLARLATRGKLNSPWGVARASFAFGLFSGDLLIGNFGNGLVNALTPAGLVTLNGTNGKPLAVAGGRGLWTLTLGGGMNSNPATLYFTSGPNQEMDGRFGTITPAQ